MFKIYSNNKAFSAITAGLILLFAVAAQAQITVSLPDTTAERGSSIWIPVNTTFVDPVNYVLTYELSVTTDDLVAAAYDTFDHTGTITPAGWSLHNYVISPDSIYGNSGDLSFLYPLSGEGPVVYFRFDIPETAVGSTDLTLAAFNYGAIYPTLESGSITISNPNVTIDGYCYLQGYSDHSGTAVEFAAVSGPAVSQTVYTDADGYYEADLVVGTYDVTYTKVGFGDEELLNQEYLDDATLAEVTLQPVVSGEYLSGALAGILPAGNSFIVNGDIWVENGAQLTIESGVTLLFDGAFTFTIEGLLIADGGENEEIIFKGNDVETYWNGIKFLDNADDNSILLHCIITECQASGVHLTGASPDIFNCEITGNSSATSGGGIVCADGASPVIEWCLINGNSALNGSGGGVLCYNASNPVIKNSTIYGNSATTFGSGIQVQSNSAPEIVNCIINGNTRQGINFTSPHNASVEYCDVYGNTNGNYTGTIPAGLGTITTTNFNGDPCDVYYNLSMNPDFVSVSGAGAFTLNDTSPCIDAGDPASGNDPDGTIRDMGRYYFHQDAPPAPTDLTATANEEVIDLAWTWTDYDIDLFNIYRGTSANPTAVYATVDYPALEYVDDEVVSGVTYYYRVTALGHNGLESDYSNEVSAVSVFNLTYYVPGDYATIQAAIDASSSGDSVIVADGTYTGVGNTNVNFLGKDIVVMSENGPDNCIIDCVSGDNRGFAMLNGETNAAVLDGFTITNGGTIDGPGIYLSESSPTIRNMIITGNHANGGSGGGIYVGYQSTPVIEYCLITDNEAFYAGGGIYCYDYGSATISNCTITGNTTGIGGGGGIRTVLNAIPDIVNCIIEGNNDVGVSFEYPNGTVTYCNIYGNAGGSVGGSIPAGLGTITTVNANGDPSDEFFNIFLDPVFVGTDDSPYELEWNSPCVDAGDPASPLDPDGTTADMGAYPLNQDEVPPRVSLPEITVTAGESVTIPLTTSMIDEADAYNSYTMQVTFDDAVANATGYDLTGTVTPSGWFPNFDFNTAGEINGGAWGVTPAISGEGTLVNFDFDVPITAYGETDLHFDFLNFDDDASITLDGKIIVTVPQFTIDGMCYLANQTDHSGTTVDFTAVSGGAVTSSDVTDAAGAYSVTLNAGVYDVTYTHADYQTEALPGEEFYADETLAELTLFREVVGTELSGEIGGMVLSAQTYTVIGDIWISVDLETIMQPGVEILFTNNTQFDVNGRLTAVGTETDSIKFKPFSEVENWGGIDFNDTADDDSELGYCLVTGSNSSGILCEDADPTITNCLFAENSGSHGAGIYCMYSEAVVENCVFYNNSSETSGGAIAFYMSNGTVTNCIMHDNSAGSHHGGALMINESSSPSINECTIFNNTATGNGGGIYIFDLSHPTIKKCTISENTGILGGGLYVGLGSNPTIINNVVAFNEDSCGIFFAGEPPDSIIGHNDLFDNEGGDLGGAVPTGLGTITTTNFNGDPCDDYNNIFLDPAFVGGGDYNLTAGSPCIDAGDENTTWDPDNTRPDIGAYYYHQDVPPAPTSLTAVDVDQTIELDWQWVDYDIDSFNIYRDTEAGATTLLTSVDDQTLAYTDSDIQSAVTYYYRVTAVGHNGLESDYSNEADAMASWTTTRLVPSQYATIQAAIDACNDGDDVLVADGTYTGVGNQNINFLGKAIVVASENGPENCMVECETGDNRGFAFMNGEPNTAVLDGFTIINGGTIDGAGIYINGSSPTIEHCVLYDNSAGTSGGGIFVINSSAIISNCTVTGNSAGSSGGGIYLGDSDADISNLIVSDNTSGVYYSNSSLPPLTYCDLYNNTGGNLTGSVPAGLGTITTVNANGDPSDEFFNIFLDPVFAGTGDNPYELLWNSPAIDAGDPASPLDPDGSTADMGAYPFDQNAAPPVVWFDDVTVTAGDQIVIPLMSSNIDSAYNAYLSYTMNIEYDADKATATEYDLTGTITPSNWSHLHNLNTAGQISGGSLSFSGPYIDGEGPLAFYTFDVPITSYGESPLHFNSFVFDDYTPEMTDGTITIIVPEVTVDGNCQLGEQTTHTGILVDFEAVSGGAVSSSVETDAAGDYNITLNAGQYNVTYSYTGYGTVSTLEDLYEATTLASVVLYPPPYNFGLLTPATGDTVWELNSLLTWEPSEDPDPTETVHYDVWVGNSPVIANMWLAADSILAAELELTGLNDDMDYYWTVRATDSNTPGTWADQTFMFQTYLVESPSAFGLESPGNGTVLHEDIVEVTWEASFDPDPNDLMQYQIDWTSDPAFGDFESEVLTETSYTITDVLTLFDEIPDDATVYWRVKAFDSFGSETWADGNPDGWSFTIDVYNEPSAFGLTSPAQGDTAWTLDALLEWADSFDPDPYDTTHYDVWVGNEADLSDAALLADSIAAPEFDLTGLDDDAVYYWTVRGTDSNTPGTWADDTLMFRTYMPESPGAFAQNSPDNGGTVHNDTVTVVWDGSVDPDPGDAIEYTVEWSLDPAFGAFETAVTSLTNYTITDIAAMFDEIPDDAVVYWRVRAEDGFGLTTWANGGTAGWSFIVDVFNAPSAFTLLSPANEDTVWTSEAAVEWDASADPDPYDTPHYDLWVGTLPNMNDSYLAADSIADVGFVLTDLMDDTTYFWTVRATDSNSPGTWADDTLMFRTFVANAPGDFELDYPANGVTVHDDTVDVSWTAAIDPDPGDVITYQVEWSLDQNYGVFEVEQTLSTTYSIENIARMYDEIPDDATVFWRVRAEDSYGLSTWANGDTTGWSFNVDVYNAPEGFSLTSPANGDTSFALEAALEWAPSYDPDPYDEVHYDVWAGTYANMNDAWLAADSIPEAMFELTDLLDDTTYYWTVRATDSNTGGTWAADTLMFRTYLPEAPGAFALAYPGNYTSVHDETVEVGWNSSLDPDPGDPVSYVVQWTLDPEFTLFDSDTTTDTTYVLEDITRRFEDLPDDAEIYWRVLAIDNYGLSTWANDDPSGWSFTVDIYNAPSVFNLLTPEYGDTSWTLTANLSWTESFDPDPYDEAGYDVWLGMTPDLSDAWLAADSIFETGLELTGLDDDAEYYWTVRATDSNTGGTWADDTLMFRTYVPEAPGAFALAYPGNYTSVHVDTVEVGWDSSVDPDPGDLVSYVVQWSLDSAFATFDSGTTADTFFVIEDLTQLFDGLPDDEVIYWRVQAEDGFGLSTWANDDPAGWSFAVDIYNAPSVFNLLTPAGGDTSWTLSADLSWTESIDPDPYDEAGYDVWLGMTPDLSDAWLAADSIFETGLELTGLDDDAEYYWTVRATDSNTGGTWADDTLMFRTYVPEAPGAFALAYPGNYTSVHVDTVEVGWDSSVDPDPGDLVSYVVQWSLDSAFATFDSGTTADTFFVIEDLTQLFDGLPDDEVIYWRVQAEDGFGLSTWANDDPAGWSFAVDIYNAPSVFNLLTPAGGDTSWTLSADLSWTESIDPDPYDEAGYDVWLGMTPDLSDAWLAADSIFETGLELTGLDDDAEYYWTVRATDSNTPGTWSADTSMFRTYQPEAPGAFALAYPEDGITIHEDEVETGWFSSEDPDPGDEFEYIVEWSLDAGFAIFDSGTTTDTFFVIADISAMFEAVSQPGTGEINGLSNSQSSNRAGGDPSLSQPLSEGGFNFDNAPLTPPENQLDALPDDAVIYWRVRAVDSFELQTWANDDPTGWWFETDLPEAPGVFGLLEPANGDTVWALEAGLSWEEAVDPDPGSIAFYDVWLGMAPDLSDAWLAADSIANLELLVTDLDDDTDYYWTVRATDSNTPGTWAEDTLMFRTYEPELPAPFSLLTPINSAILTPGETEFSWEESIDPDPGDVVSYTLWFIDMTDSASYDVGSAVSVMVNPDTVSVLTPGIPAVWYVTAFSAYPESLIESLERFDFTPPNLAEIIDVVVSAEGTNLILTWTAPLGTQGNYKIYRNETPYFDLTAAQTVFVFSGPTTGVVTWTNADVLAEFDQLFYIVTHELLPLTAGAEEDDPAVKAKQSE